MIQVLLVTDFLSFIWDIIDKIKDGVLDIINFLKDLITFLPKILDILPDTIKYMLLPVITILIFVSIYKFVK